MRRTDVADLRPGLVVRRPVYSPRGDLLLTEGAELTERLIAMLAERLVVAVYVESATGGAGDETLPVIVSERVRTTVVLGLCQVYDLTASDFILAAHVARMLQDEIERIVAPTLEHEATLEGLATLRAFDNYQFFHALDSTVVAVMLGRRLRLGAARLERIATGCLLHDLGMTRIDRTILNRAGPLSAAERAIVAEHVPLGYELLRRMRPNRVIENSVALQHHERQDGAGYPRGLGGRNAVPTGLSLRGVPGEILPDAEIVAVADVYDALTSDRPWRPALLPDVIVRTMRGLAGSHLNAAVVRELLEMVPPYPLGATVIVARGRHLYHRGIVVQVHRGDFDRPTVRLLQNERLDAIDPIDVDLRATGDVIACIPPPGHDPVTEMTPEAEATLRAASTFAGRARR